MTTINALTGGTVALADEMEIDQAGVPRLSRKTTAQDVIELLNALTATFTNKTIDWTDNTMALTSAELATALSDESGSGLAVFNDSPTLVTPALGTPASGVMTNVTGLTNAGIVAAAGIDLSKIDAITFTERIPLIMEVPEGTVGFPDIHALATGVAKISGMVLPDGASDSIINFKCNVPDNLAATPAASIKFIIMSQTAETGANIRLTVETLATDDAGNIDQALTAETEATVPIPAAAETLEYYDQDMTTDPTAGEILIVQVTRNPADGSDTYAGDPMIIGAYLEIDRTIT